MADTDTEFKKRTIDAMPGMACSECVFYKTAGGYSKPCSQLGVAEDSHICDRYIYDLKRSQVKDREALVNVARMCGKTGIDPAKLFRMLVSSRNLKTREFGEAVLIPMSSAPTGYVEGTVIGERRGKLHVVNGDGMVAVITNAGLKTADEIKDDVQIRMNVTVTFDGVTTTVKKPRGSKTATPAAKTRPGKVGSVIALRGEKADEATPADKPKPKANARKAAGKKGKDGKAAPKPGANKGKVKAKIRA